MGRDTSRELGEVAGPQDLARYLHVRNFRKKGQAKKRVREPQTCVAWVERAPQRWDCGIRRPCLGASTNIFKAGPY